MARMMETLRRWFYRAQGPWWRVRLFELCGSQRYSRPALHDMERKLEALFPAGRTGTFLEAGAHDGFTQSNTYFLERHRGWTGVLVEAVPELERRARRRRTARVVHAALVGPDHREASVAVQFGDLTSHVGEADGRARAGLDNAGRRGYETVVPARTLDSILDECGVERLDLLVLDIEGHEPEALRGLDLERHPVDRLVVEVLDPPAQLPALERQLAPHLRLTGMLSLHDALFSRAGLDDAAAAH